VDDRTKASLRRANEIQRAVMDELGADVSWTVGPESTGPAFHHMGTTRMGTDPDESVVNARMQTHDLGNLTIASSSVFRTSGALNPTLTIGALALKAADHVDKRL
jgi:choline dehydrogenase-like flavoprotein